MLLANFDETHTNKLKHLIKNHASRTYFKLIQYLRKYYNKLRQLNMSEILTNIASYFDINEGFAKCIERMKEAQKIAAIIDANLINDATLLRMRIEAMCNFGLFDKVPDQWE